MFINLSEVGGVTLSCGNPAPLKLMCSVCGERCLRHGYIAVVRESVRQKCSINV